MSKGTLIVSVITAAFALFVLFAVVPFISGDSDNYNTKGGGLSAPTVQVDEAVIVTEEAPSPAVVEEPEVMMEKVEEATETAMAEEVTEDTMTEAVVEQMDETTEAAMEQADTMMEKMDEAAEEVMTETETVVAEVTEQVETAVEKPVAEVAATGQIHVVTAQGLKYAPMVIQIQVGDTVSWENMSSHDTQAMEGLFPAGAMPWHSAMGESFQHTFTVEGIYIYKCTPHFGAGMGGAVIVGNPVNLEEIKAVKVKGAAKRLVKKALAVAEKM